MIATGVQWRRLEAPGIDRLQGAGVYYGGGSTEALSCKGEIVYVVGGANSAGQAAMNFAKYAERVVILVRGSSLSSTMSQYLIDQIKQTPNIQIWTHASVAEAHGETHLEEISVLCSDTNKIERVPASAMFIFIGALPRTDWLADLVERDERGFILTGPDLMRDGKRPKGWALERDPFLLETNIPGLFAVAMSAMVGQARGFRSGRRLSGGAIHPSVFEQGISMVEKSELLRSLHSPICRRTRSIGFSAMRRKSISKRANLRPPGRSRRLRCLSSWRDNYRRAENLAARQSCFQQSRAMLPACCLFRE